MAFDTNNRDQIYTVLRTWDSDPHWPERATATLILLGGVALAFYQVSEFARRTTEDIDGMILRSTLLPDQLLRASEQLGISFRAGTIAWLPQDWEEHIQWSSWRFDHLIVGWLDPYDWIITKLGRWQRHDMTDVIAVVENLDPNVVLNRVRAALPEYIGNLSNLNLAWNDLVDALAWPPSFKQLTGRSVDS